MLTAKALLPIRRFPMFHHIRSLTGGTLNWLYDHHRRSFPGLDVYDTAAPLVCLYQGGLRKSTNLGHYRRTAAAKGATARASTAAVVAHGPVAGAKSRA